MDELSEDRRERLKRRSNDAIWTHHTWVSILRRAIAQRCCEHTVAAIRDAGNCEIGRWLNDEISPEFRATELYSSTHRTHERFHEEAAGVLRLALAGDKPAALARMERGGTFFLAAANMRSVLYEWAATAQAE